MSDRLDTLHGMRFCFREGTVQSALKREFLFWLASAAICGGYLALGHWLTPEVPDQPDYSTDADGSPAVIRVDGLQELQNAMKQMTERRNTIEAKWREKKQNQLNFLRRWYQWGAGIGIGLVLIYSWWRPPWRDAMQQNSDSTSQKNKNKHSETVFQNLPVSRSALLGMMAALLAGIVLLTVIAAMSQ